MSKKVKKKTNKAKKKEVNFRRTLIILLFAYLIYSLIMLFLKLPIKNIEIIGNKNTTDYQIINVAGIKDYPPIFQIHKKKTEEKIKKIELIKNVEIHKHINGKLTINIEEKKPLFYKKINQMVVLDENTEIKDQGFLGIPVLINFVPDTIYKEFVKKYSNLAEDAISNINYLEYQPSKNEKGETIDETRFLLVMNDSNLVYTNSKKIDNLNYYLNILSRLEGKKGKLFLDSGNYDNFIFEPFN